MTDTIMTIVDTLERVERLRRGLNAKRRAVAEAKAEIENAGWNKSAAVRKVDAAAEALAVQETEIADLLAGLPDVREDSTRWMYGRVAELRVEKRVFAKRVAAAEKAVEEAATVVDVDAWKWKARAAKGEEPKAVVAARSALAEVQKAARAFEEESAEIMAMFDAHVTVMQEQEEVNAWAASGYEGERPECIQRSERAFAAEMEEGCERIPLAPPGARRYIAITTTGPMPVEDPDMDFGAGEWGTPMTAEQYLNQLVPPPPEPVKEEFCASTKGGTPVWIKRILNAKKARAAAMVAVA